MGEAERGESAPRRHVPFYCANGHVTRPSFSLDASVPDQWDCPRCGLPAGQDSYFMFLDTNAHHYARNAVFDLASNGYTHNSDQFSTFGVAGVPEPASWALMILGFGAGGAMLRRRRPHSAWISPARP